MEIKHDNILYVSDINVIGGVETFLYEMVKKYKDLDIAVIYRTADTKQLQRLKKYCYIYKFEGQKINCKVAIINYDISIINYIDEKAKIYQVIHADYENPAYTSKPPTHPRVTKYIAITKYLVESFKKITGNKNVILSYNPLTIEKEKPLITLISATRLSKEKGKDRMIKLAQALDKANINYIWYIFTNDKKETISPNVIYMDTRLDVNRWLQNASYLVQLSDTEAYSYSINEALNRNVPVICTKFPYLNEIGLKDGINGYLMDFDCSNIDYIVKNIEKIPKFEYKPIKDSYDKLLAPGESIYQKKLKNKVKVKCIENYLDLELGKNITTNDLPYIVTELRAEELLKAGENGVVKIL